MANRSNFDGLIKRLGEPNTPTSNFKEVAMLTRKLTLVDTPRAGISIPFTKVLQAFCHTCIEVLADACTRQII